MINNSPDSPPSVTIVIVTWNSAEDIGDCLSPLVDLPANWNVIVVDNQSSDATAAIIERDFPRVRLKKNKENSGFAAACNMGARETSSDYVLFLNPDARCTSENLGPVLEIAHTSPKTGILGVRLINEDGTLQRSCDFFPTPFKALIDGFGLYRFFRRERLSELFADEFFDHETERSVDWLMGAFLFCRRECLDATGGIPEDYFMFGEDMDFCWQAQRAGFDVRFTPEISVIHKKNRSAGQLASRWRVERTVLSRHLFCLKEFGAIRGRIVQVTDFFAELLRGLRSGTAVKAAESRERRAITRRSIFMSAEEIRRQLNSR
jgi:GT2 family glycosyltransferase